jgi:hypothetical protein
VRPLIGDELITQNILTARERGNAITCTKFNETVAVSADDTITEVIPRDHIYAAQAPQTFHLDEILALYDEALAAGEHDSIDSCSLMEAHGRTLYRVEGPRSPRSSPETSPGSSPATSPGTRCRGRRCWSPAPTGCCPPTPSTRCSA